MSLINTVICIAGAVCLHLLFEAPFGNLEKELLQPQRKDTNRSLADIRTPQKKLEIKLSSEGSDSQYSSGSSLSNQECEECSAKSTQLPIANYSDALKRWQRHEFIANVPLPVDANGNFPIESKKSIEFV